MKEVSGLQETILTEKGLLRANLATKTRTEKDIKVGRNKLKKCEQLIYMQVKDSSILKRFSFVKKKTILGTRISRIESKNS